eukprot:750939-Hanusia_phi.AAC.4
MERASNGCSLLPCVRGAGARQIEESPIIPVVIFKLTERICECNCGSEQRAASEVYPQGQGKSWRNAVCYHEGNLLGCGQLLQPEVEMSFSGQKHPPDAPPARDISNTSTTSSARWRDRW